MCAVEAVLDIAALGGNTGLMSSATMLLNASYYGNAPIDTDYDMGVLSLAVASGEATPFIIATALYDQVRNHSQHMSAQECPICSLGFF